MVKRDEEDEEKMEEAAKPDFLDKDKDGNTDESFKDAVKDAEENEGDSDKKDDSEEKEESGDENLSKVPPQLRKHVKSKKKNESLQESVDRVLKSNKKIKLRFK